MFVNLFGKFLISQNIISEDELFSIEMELNKTKVMLGLIAVSEKLMTEKQAELVNKKQKMMDKRFGDIAVELGFLNREQVDRLLQLQGNPYFRFCQVAIDKEIMSLEAIEDAMEKFRIANNFTISDIEAVKTGDVDRILPLYLPQLPVGPLGDLIAVVVRSLIRLVSSDLYIEKGYVTSNYKTGCFALQNMDGDYKAATIFSGDEKGILAVAEGFAKEFFEEVNEEALDSVAEFINIANGLFSTGKSFENQMKIMLSPPVYSTQSLDISSSSIYVLPLEVNQQAVDLCISL